MSYAVASLIRRFRQEPLSTALIDAHAGWGGSLGSAALSLADGLHVVPEFPLLLKRVCVCLMSWNAWRAWTAYLHRYRERSQTSIAGAALRSRFFRQLNEKCDLSSFESEFDPEVRDEPAQQKRVQTPRFRCCTGPLAIKLAPTACGQNREQTCV
ncbi:hypothetical protein [Pseudomonas amygdali]|uniref:hypothetical protein n=1 Tax=Pseudomonas amygdali TaxID=47877 RepID=UPI001FB687F3|nr:hypothetical protein [Pseudomonas amygdali]UPT37695.1 hypothetical protein LT107_03240 [Pseudomonas amygdali pv. loropetali]